MADKWQLHWSHLSMLWRCGEQYRRRYVEGEIVPPGIALIIGSGTHKAIEPNIRRMIDTGEAASLEEVHDVARDYVVKEFKRGAYWLSPEERAAGRPKQHWQDQCVNWAVTLAGLHHDEIAPSLKPTHIERPWVVELPGYPCDLAGRLDIQEGTSRLHDTKTKAQSPSQAEVDGSDQFTMYGIAVKVLDGRMPRSYRLDALVKTKTPKAVSLSTQRTKEDFAALLRRIEISVKAIEAGIFLPCERANWCCDPKWCGFYPTCPYTRGRKQFAMKRDA